MSDAWDDWEQADEAEFQAPVVIQKPTKMTAVAPQPRILQRGRQGQEDTPLVDKVELGNVQSLHERNRTLWDKANAYEQPIIARSDDNHMRTEYVPEIKILRRPKSPVATARVGRTTPKPLAQREADYNAAREKIFGTSSTTSISSAHSSAGSNASTPSARSKCSSPIQSPAPSASASATKSEMEVKPIEFNGVPPSTRLVQKPSLAVRGNAVRQPRGPNATVSTPQSSSSQTSPSSSPSSSQTSSPARLGAGSSGSRQEGSIGFRRPFRGAPRPPPSASSS